jgi:hypothetical protein
MGLFSAIIGGIEHTAEDFGSLLDSAASEIESLGISMAGGTYHLVKFLLTSGEDPVAAIQQITSRIESVGGDIASTLDELGSGILQYGLYGFAQKKANELLTPLQNSLQTHAACTEFSEHFEIEMNTSSVYDIGAYQAIYTL